MQNVVSINKGAAAHEATAAPSDQGPSVANPRLADFNASARLDRHIDLESTPAIRGALAYAQVEGDIVCVHGPSGTGKTTALRHYAETHHGATYVAMSVAVRTPAGMLSRVADALGAGATHRSALAAETAIASQLRDRDAILIVDEAQCLSAPLLDELRCIRDIARCGLALAGDDLLRATLEGSRRCEQIVGRIGGWISLEGASAEDVLTLAAAAVDFRPDGAAADRVLREARAPGGLHALRRMLVKVILEAQGESRAVRVDDLVTVPGAS